MSVLVINQHRQIIFCNDVFSKLAQRKSYEEVQGLRPGEALDCIHSIEMPGGCGCSYACRLCGAAKAIIKSLEGEGRCEKCKILRYIDGVESPLDIQAFTKPIQFKGKPFTLFVAIDITHELRLKYLERTFYHGLINAAGGLSQVADMLDADPNDKDLFPLIHECSSQIVRNVMYHRDVTAAEAGTLAAISETFDAVPFFEKLVKIECNTKNVPTETVQMNILCNTITSDKRLLGHVVRTMLENALESSEKSGAPIGLSCMPNHEGHIVISVRNAQEIQIDIQRLLFKRYVSTKDSARGLGVYFMKLLATQYLNGDVSFISGGGGTEFNVRIPDCDPKETSCVP